MQEHSFATFSVIVLRARVVSLVRLRQVRDFTVVTSYKISVNDANCVPFFDAVRR